MVPREIERLAPTKDATIKPRKEEFVLGMVQKEGSMCVAIKDAPSGLRRKDYVNCNKTKHGKSS